MKLIFIAFFVLLSINCVYGQNHNLSIKAKMPLLRGYDEYQTPINGIYISQAKSVTLFSDCDSVFSTEAGKIITSSESSKDTLQRLIIRSGNLRLFYFGLKQLNVKKGDRIVAGQFIGLAHKISDETYSITFQVGDNKVIVWGRNRQENYLNKPR